MHSYEIRFFNIPPSQIEYLLYEFEGYVSEDAFDTQRWECKFGRNSVTLQFATEKHFNPVANDSSNSNLVRNLLGKNQFFGNIWQKWTNDDVDIDGVQVVFVADAGKQWDVELGKFGSMTPRSRIRRLNEYLGYRPQRRFLNLIG